MAVFLLVAVRGWGRALATTGVMTVAFVAPILVYCTVSLAQTGHFWLSAGQPNSGRMAYAADCATLKLPPAVRPLCPIPRRRRTARTGSSTPASRRCTRRRSRPARTARS